MKEIDLGMRLINHDNHRIQVLIPNDNAIVLYENKMMIGKTISSLASQHASILMLWMELTCKVSALTSKLACVQKGGISNG